MKVKNLKIREIFATNSVKTIEVELETDKSNVCASAPIGTSKSKYEVTYLPTEKIVATFPDVKKYFIGRTFLDLNDVDTALKALDGTANFNKIGGNLALALSFAFAKAFAAEEDKDLFSYFSSITKLKIKPKIPLPLCNVVGGWSGQSDIQEFLLFPKNHESFFKFMEKISTAYLAIGHKIKSLDKSFKFGKNLESAWITNLNVEQILNILSQFDLNIGIDFAASQFWDGEKYAYSTGALSTMQQLSVIEDLVERFPIKYIEDPFHQEDFISFSTITQHLGKKVIIAGDDIFSTNLNRLKIGINYGAANAIVIKPNQIGTLSDAIAVIEEAKRNDIKTVVSHRSGETEDTLICHLAVGLGCDFIKIGISGERTIKINEMIRIEEKFAH